MIYMFSYNNGVKIKIWIDEFPECTYRDIDIFYKCYQTNKLSTNKFKKVAIELQIPINISNYCMLGIRFKDNTRNAEIIIHTSNYKEDIYHNNLGINPDIIHKGIPSEYVSGIVECFDKNNNLGLLEQGYYEFIIGAHAEVGSSNYIFNKTTNILLKVLQEKTIDKSLIWNIIQSEFEGKPIKDSISNEKQH